MLLKLSEFRGDGNGSSAVFINTDEVAFIRKWNYHSFRPAITEVGLNTGEKIHVWEEIEIIEKRLAATKGSNRD
jgi:hypothetical protein